MSIDLVYQGSPPRWAVKAGLIWADGAASALQLWAGQPQVLQVSLIPAAIGILISPSVLALQSL